MVDIASNIMLADERVLWLAQREAKACSRIVRCLQRIATHRLASGAHVYSTVSARYSRILTKKVLCLKETFSRGLGPYGALRIAPCLWSGHGLDRP